MKGPTAMQIPLAALLSILSTAAAALLAWIIAAERRFLTRADHKAICETQNAELNKKLDALKASLERQAAAVERQSAITLRHRDTIHKKLNRLGGDIHIIRTRMG